MFTKWNQYILACTVKKGKVVKKHNNVTELAKVMKQSKSKQTKLTAKKFLEGSDITLDVNIRVYHYQDTLQKRENYL